MISNTHSKHCLKITFLSMITAMIVTLPACKHSNSTISQPNTESTTVNHDASDNQEKTRDLTKDSPDNPITANDNQLDAQDNNNDMIYSDFSEAAQRNANKLDRCFEEYAIELVKTKKSRIYGIDHASIFHITIDSNGLVKDLKTSIPSNMDLPLNQCLSKFIKSFRFQPGAETTNLEIVEHSNSAKITDINFSDSIRTCYEKYHLSEPNSVEYTSYFFWEIDKDGKTQSIQQLKDVGSLDKVIHLDDNANFNPTITQQNVPVIEQIANPYDFDLLDFKEENESELKNCSAKAHVSNDYYGFNLVINPDGSIEKVSYAGIYDAYKNSFRNLNSDEDTSDFDQNTTNTGLNENVKDCYINLLKKWHFKPTLTGKKLYMYYTFEIGDDN